MAVINTGKAHTQRAAAGCDLGSSPYLYELQISVFRIIDICNSITDICKRIIDINNSITDMCEHHFKCIDLIVLQISLKELKISEIELQISANVLQISLNI